MHIEASCSVLGEQFCGYVCCPERHSVAFELSMAMLVKRCCQAVTTKAEPTREIVLLTIFGIIFWPPQEYKNIYNMYILILYKNTNIREHTV